jgi:CRISPR system Cascade subunit CasA
MLDLLKDELIGVRTARGTRMVSLPGLLALLCRGEVEGYTGLRPHQADPWHVFLVQIAASVLARAPRDPPPGEEGFWREGLLDLADGQATAWELVVEDPTKPAFMQHPWRDQDEKKAFKPKASTPDELDILVTAKDHDVKAARVSPDQPEAWLFSLLTYQTMSGFLGAGNFGIVRMNGGFASRPIVSLVSSLDPSPRFREELSILLQVRPGLLAAGLGYQPKGVVLTWLSPWNRDGHQHMLSDLEPHFIEAARPLRLVQTGQGLVALGATSKVRQIGPASVDGGDVGDPWIPINVSDKKKGRSALSVSANGFTPKLLAGLLFERDFELTPLQRPRLGSGTACFAGSVLVRGQGKTEGFHRFALPVPEKAKLKLLQGDSRSQMGAFAQDLLLDAAVADKALHGALMTFAEGGPASTDFGSDTIKAWAGAAISAFSHAWEERFFPTLWRWAEEDAEALRAQWKHWLANRALEILDEAEGRLPIPSNRRYRARVRARGFLAGSLIKQGLLPKPNRIEPMEEAQ